MITGSPIIGLIVEIGGNLQSLCKDSSRERQRRCRENFGDALGTRKGMLFPIAFNENQEDRNLNQLIGVTSAKPRGTPDRNETGQTDVGAASSLDLMAASSHGMVALINRMQESNEAVRTKKVSESSILKTMGQTQRELFMKLATKSMSREPEMSEFMKDLTTNKSPKKAIH